MPIDFNKLTDKIVKRVVDNLQGSNPDIQNAGEQVGESFVNGIEQGLGDATNRIAASSLKINKAFKDLAKRITNQKDIFNISLGGKNVVLDIDFSDIDINSADFQKKINEVFEKFKIDNTIEFDSKTTEKKFKDMLGLHVKYTDKLSKLQNQSTKLTKPESIKANVQEQLAIIDGLKEIQRVLDKTSGMSISLPHVYSSSSTKDLRTIIETLDRVQKGEEKVGKQRDTNVEKIRKENKELKERNKILEEHVGPIEEGQESAKKSRSKKSESPVDVKGESIKKEMTEFASELLNLQKELGDSNKWLNQYNILMGQVQQGALTAAEAIAKLREEMAKPLTEDEIWESIDTLRSMQEQAGEGVYWADRGEIHPFGDFDSETDEIKEYAKQLHLTQAEAEELYRDVATYNDAVRKISDARNGVGDLGGLSFEEVHNSDTPSEYLPSEINNPNFVDTAEKFISKLQEQNDQIVERNRLMKESVVEDDVEQNKIIDDQNAKLEERNRLINEYIAAEKKAQEIESKYGDRFRQDVSLEDYNEWSKARMVQQEISMHPDSNEIQQSARAKMAEEQKRITEETANIEAKADEQSVVAEQTELDLTKEELKVEKEITKEKQVPEGASGTQQEIKSQEELQKKIEDTNRTIKIQKEWLDYIDPVLDDETYKASGKKDAADKLKFRTNNLMDYRLHPEEYEWKQMYEEKVSVAQAKAYKEAERQGVAQSRLNKYYTDAVSSHDINVKKLQEERALHEKILADAEKELEVLQQQLQTETKIEEVRKPKFKRTIDGEPKKFRMKKSEVDQGVQTTIDDIVPKSTEDTTPKVEAEAGGFDKVDKAADRAANSKKKFTKANKEVAASVTPSVKGLETEVDAMENVEEAAKKTSKTVSEEAKRAAEGMNFHTRDYEKLYDEMEAFAEQRKAENGYDLSKVSVNTDAHGNPLGATISYYKKATKETITETFKIDEAAQEAEEGVNRLVLSSRKATAGIADFEKATLGAINKQNNFAINTEKTISTMSAALDANANRTLIGKDGENEVREKLEAIKAEAEKLKQDPNGVLDPLPEREFLAAKKRIAELIQEARVLIREKKNAAYGETLESNAVDAGTYRKDNLKAQINEWKRAGIYVGDLQNKGEALLKTVGTITDHAGLKKYLIGVKEANALAKLAIQNKKAEEEKQKKLNEEYESYIALVEKRNKIELQMMGLDPKKNRDKLAALQAEYDAVDNEFNSKYGDFLARDDFQERVSMEEFATRRKIDVKAGEISDKKRLEEEAAAQKKVNEAYREYVALVQERGRASVKLAGLDPEKNKDQIDNLTAYIDGIDDKLNETYGGLLSNHIAQATLTLEDFMKYYDKWQQKLAEKEAQAADKARQKEEKPYRDYGKTTANSAARKRDRLQGEVDALGVTNPDILAKIDNYNAKVQKVLDLRAQFNSNPNAAKDPELVKQFQTIAAEADRAYKGIKAVIDEEQRMAQLSAEQGFEPIELSADQMSNLENTMISHAKATAQGRVEIKGWNADHTKMNYTVTNSKGVVEEMTMALGQGRNTMYQYRTATKETGTLIQQVFKGIKTKAKELLSFVIGGGSVYKVIELLRQGIQYVRDIDLALTELRKVTDETEEEYEQFLQTAAKTGARLGTTISAVTEATATFAKLGYEIEQATEMAEAAIVYKNVGDNIASTEDAADSIISTMKGFRLEASESMAIVDRFNEVGNRFAITSQGIGEALRLSASALSEGGNSLDESIGLITAANEVVNDPSSVGTALKTLTLRLRGSKTELEEMGEDVSDMATTTSALQAKLLALTGGQVDIMLDENTFKNSTQILREMAGAWEDMTDIQRASALELMGGKRQANVLSALISNFDTVEKVIETSANSAGSALEENERYLDSIQGKIDQFNNAMQSLWNNLLDDDMVKGVVSWGTKIIKSLDTIEGKFLALVKVLAIFMAYKKINPLDWVKQASTFFATFQDKGLKGSISLIWQYVQGLLGIGPAMKTATVASLENTIATQTNDKAKTAQMMKDMGLIGVTGTLSKAQREQARDVILNAMAHGQLTNAQGNAMLAMLGYGAATKAADGSLKALDVSTKSFMATNPVGWILAIVSAAMALISVLSLIPSRTEKLKEEISDLNSEISDINSEIDSLNSELETANDRMAELLAMPSLSFIEQEELKELQLTTAELERQVELQKALAEDTEKKRQEKIEKQIGETWTGQGEWAMWNNGEIYKDSGWAGFWADSKETNVILDDSISKYRSLIDAQNIYNQAQKELEDNGELGSETIGKLVRSNPEWNRVDSTDEEASKWVKRMYGGAHQALLDDYRDNSVFSDIEKIDKGIDDVLSAQYDFIRENNLEYGDNQAINDYLDEVNTYRLAYEQAQGASVKYEAFSTMFDSTATEDMQKLGKELQKIADDDTLTDEQKTNQIKDRINSIDLTAKAYNRLRLAMDNLGVVAQDMADYFVLDTGVFDSNTVEGIANQYQHMESVLNALKGMSDNKFTFDGAEYNWDEFFTQDDQGKFEAKAVKFSEILNGMDKESRETFINIVESAANAAGDLSKIDWNQAISKLDLAGIDRTFKLLNDEFETLNNEMFAGAADEISGLIDTVSELQAALEDVASTMDTLYTAQEQMNSSGRVSVKTALELMQSTEDWDKILEITNGTIRLRQGAEEHLIQTELTAIQTQLHYAWTTAKARYETALAAQGELDYADNSNVVMTAESIKAEAIGRVSAVVVALGAAMDEITKGNWGSAFSAFGSTYQTATATVVADAQQYATTLGELKKNAENSEKLYKAGLNVTPSVSDFKDNWDFDETPGDKYGNDEKSKAEEAIDKFQLAMDYWENRIGANQARYEQLQNEIDLLESKGQKADASYYEEQIKLENERLSLLEQQKAEAQSFLGTFAEGSDEWWEVASQLNDIEGDIDGVTASIQGLNDAIAEVNWYKFEEPLTRFDNYTDTLETIRTLVAPNGEEDWFDDEGNWTEEGVTVAGTYVQEIEMDKQSLDEVNDLLNNKLSLPYEGNEEYYKSLNLGIDSEQDLYDKREEYQKKAEGYYTDIQDNQQNIVDMYEAQIDAVEEYIETLIDGYNDYIDSVKEALDAERDLYEFKKNVQKQSKDIAELERKIASLSGSTNKSEIAEKRKLEAQLYEAREGLNDTYYDHSKDALNNALDAEQSAYEETMNKFIEGLRIGLEEATRNMDEFLMSVTGMVTLNADTVLQKYQETKLPLDDALTNPWEAAKEAVGDYSGDALDLMNQWAQNGFFTTTPEKIKGSLESPWSAGQTAVGAFKTSVDTKMGEVVSAIETNVKTASTKLSQLYQQIEDTEKRAASVGSGAGGGNYASAWTPPETQGTTGSPETPAPEKPKELTEAQKMVAKIVRFGSAKGSGMNAGKKGDNGVVTWDKKEYAVQNSGVSYGKGTNLYKAVVDHLKFGDRQIFGYDGGVYGYLDGAIQKLEGRFWSKKGYNDLVSYARGQYTSFAKGTTGTTRDQWAITNEPQFGDELTMYATPEGTLSFMRAGSTVVPADITANLVEWGKLNPDMLNVNGMPNVNMISNAVNKPELNITFDSLVKAENITEETLPAVKKLVTQELNRFTKELNYALKGKGAR